jgi:LysM domain
MDESLEYFSSQGKPLRASMSLNLSQQSIQEFAFADSGGAGAAGGAPSTPGTAPLAQAPAGSTLPGIAAANGSGSSWQSIASANGIENPRQLAAGQLIDLNLGVR